jgi:mannose-1-phosphate guanylyltransferase
MKNITPVILSGGSGTRLWPLSRKYYPKQFINLINENTSVFQDTILRLPKIASEPLVVCNEDHRFLVAEQLRQVDITPCDIILEPTGKNTAPAITLAAMNLISKGLDPIMLVLPADHKIDNIAAFHESVDTARVLAEDNKLVTFGIIPSRPKADYGYIKVDKIKNQKYHQVISFTEKPDLKTAEKFFKDNSYYWNSGMFMFKASTLICELEKFAPKITENCFKSYEISQRDLDFTRIDIESFNKCPSLSIDYALMEHTKKAVVVPIDVKWDDIGSWESINKLKKFDKSGNSSTGDVIIKESKNTHIYSYHKLVTVYGISDLLIVDTHDALMVTTKDNSDNIKKIVSSLQQENRPELDDHRKVYRPWGYFDLIDTGNGFQVKRILVKPGKKLSLQKHLHRAEHWVVISGKASITCGTKNYILNKNQSAFIPRGAIHRLENREKSPLEIIEIQTGDYFGEDDIIRIEDDFSRV